MKWKERKTKIENANKIFCLLFLVFVIFSLQMKPIFWSIICHGATSALNIYLRNRYSYSRFTFFARNLWSIYFFLYFRMRVCVCVNVFLEAWSLWPEWRIRHLENFVIRITIDEIFKCQVNGVCCYDWCLWSVQSHLLISVRKYVKSNKSMSWIYGTSVFWYSVANCPRNCYSFW